MQFDSRLAGLTSQEKVQVLHTVSTLAQSLVTQKDGLSAEQMQREFGRLPEHLQPVAQDLLADWCKPAPKPESALPQSVKYH